MRETTKSKALWGPDSIELKVLKGKGLDIGAGGDLISPHAQSFDIEDGDANEVSLYVHDRFDYVYASHCLEHMFDPGKTILDWWKLVKVGGHIYVTIPDEDLYEQGVFPSRFNPDHKATFTIQKTESWSPRSINVLDLARSLPGGEIVRVTLQDHGYDRTLMTFGPRKRNPIANFFIRIYRFLERHLGFRSKALEHLFLRYEAIDQTRFPERQAQIQCIVKKISE